MPQMTLYLPDDLEAALREAAQRAGKSLSAYVADLARGAVKPTTWPAGFADLAGSWEGDFPEAQDAPPEPVEPL